MSGQPPNVMSTDPASSRVAGRLKLYFASLSCLGGLVLASGSETEMIPVVAVFFAVFGYVFVDWLELFALPPIAAYTSMGVAALYCVSDFTDLDAPGNHQMIAVAQLLVFVQAILMLQKKSRRIFEQLGVFCLLQLVVAAVFNNAINYGLLLIPITMIAAWALSLLAALSASEGLGGLGGLSGDENSTSWLRRPEQSSSISVASANSAQSLATAALRLPRVALITLAPSVMLVGAIFFYALPRTTDAARVRNRGTALVGFSEQMRLEQIGQMLQSSETALRLYMTDRSTGQIYNVLGGVYLRGRVLERYQPQLTSTRNTAIWSSVPFGLLSATERLPGEYIPMRITDANFYDAVDVSVVCESMRNDSLFAVAPYHRTRNDPEIMHQAEHWTVSRRSNGDLFFPRKNYSFGTHAFQNGVQSDLVARASPNKDSLVLGPGMGRVGQKVNRRREATEDQRSTRYVKELLRFDIDSTPTAATLAERFVTSPDGQRRADYAIAKAMERHLSTAGDFRYTLNLSAESVPGLDPIEQFLAVDKKGHCQYFASALVMMLRSQGIPARIVVGYHTDEFNELSQHYVARQLHAHSWVEALIDRDQLNANRNVYGQPPAQQYWLRLDPTPAGGRIRDSSGGVGQMLDMAQNMWDDYVVDMDAGRQDSTLLGGGINPMNQSYERVVDWLSLKISRIRAGELGGGSLASRELFSWPAAVLGVLMTLTMAALLRFRAPAWVRRRLRSPGVNQPARPSVEFYARTLDQLARVGINRHPSQTPEELMAVAREQLHDPRIPAVAGPLMFLTSRFYRVRFGASAEADSAAEADLDPKTQKSRRHAGGQSVEVDQALTELTRSVDLMLAGTNKAERAT